MRYDALIVGGSYAGLSGAVQIARSGRPVCVLDSGRPRNRFASHSHGFFGQDRQSPRQMIAQARADLAQYPNVTMLDTLAAQARRDGDAFAVTLASGETLHARKLLLAYGVVDLLPDLPGVAERWGQTVLHCPYCHGTDGRLIRVGALFLASRIRPASDLAEQLGCTFVDGPQGPLIQTDAGKQTSVPGVYAAGDLTPGIGNASMAAADGVLAGASLHQSLIFGPLSALERVASA
ncbi:thioredoxin reductase [Deinococcus sp. HSC-46F16]|uniref:NAD(P)/FAD-dependent oxidoreductase n=1 Tax=Deinococcus sp. HSC-46F16 TaxID=2910968 RepID=UPI00209F6314|nr:NAD(P)/FAD-dependent oxidoreductase [Deinococcus sp. HSC-46F16]MCP2014549.1 thioredoxin reductase [Deinococcus sp. HSC-46F16]